MCVDVILQFKIQWKFASIVFCYCELFDASYRIHNSSVLYSKCFFKKIYTFWIFTFIQFWNKFSLSSWSRSDTNNRDVKKLL